MKHKKEEMTYGHALYEFCDISVRAEKFHKRFMTKVSLAVQLEIFK